MLLDDYNPFAGVPSDPRAYTVDPSTVVFVGGKFTYSRFFVSGATFSTMDGKSHRVTGMGYFNDFNSIFIYINGTRTKLTNTTPRRSV